jgi:GNAT superfamily N-acetyltransferase
MYQLLPCRTDAMAIEAYSRLLGTVFNQRGRFTSAYLQWLYAANPTGGVIGYDAWLPEGNLAAHYATIPVSYTRDGHAVRGLLSLNTASAAAHQGKGLFTELAGHTYQAAAEAGYHFIIGVANAASIHGFVQKLGFAHLLTLQARLGYCRSQGPAEGAAFGSTFSAEQLAWRLAKPSGCYFATEHTLYAPTGFPLIAAQLSARALPLGFLPRRQPALTLWLGHVPHALRLGASMAIPNRLKPAPLHLIYLDLTGQAVPKPEELAFEALDFDAY